jgi:hypothetical protein
MWFLEHGLQVPTRNPHGETCWKRPIYRSMHRMLTSPIYGGAYTYVKTEQLVRYDGGKPRYVWRRKPREQWFALIPGAHEGYVSWEEFERIAGAIRDNMQGEHQPFLALTGAGCGLPWPGSGRWLGRSEPPSGARAGALRRVRPTPER